MKKLTLILAACLVIGSVSAQYHGRVGGHIGVSAPRTRVVIGTGFGLGYGYGYGYYPYSAFGYPYPYAYGPSYRVRPSKLDMQIMDIRHDYDQKISSAKLSLSGKAKRVEVRQLKHDRDAAIEQARYNYYRS